MPDPPDPIGSHRAKRPAITSAVTPNHPRSNAFPAVSQRADHRKLIRRPIQSGPMINTSTRRAATRQRPSETLQQIVAPARSRSPSAVACLVVGHAALERRPPMHPATARAAVIPDGDPYVPPSVTIETPSTDDCAQRNQPPPRGGHLRGCPARGDRPTPLPVPANPVGGGRLGECGLIVPDGRAPAAVGHLGRRLADRRPGHRRGARREGPARPVPPGQHAEAADRACRAEEPEGPRPDRRGHRQRRRPGRHPGRHGGRRQVHGPAAADLPDHHVRATTRPMRWPGPTAATTRRSPT